VHKIHIGGNRLLKNYTTIVHYLSMSMEDKQHKHEKMMLRKQFTTQSVALYMYSVYRRKLLLCSFTKPIVFYIEFFAEIW